VAQPAVVLTLDVGPATGAAVLSAPGAAAALREGVAGLAGVRVELVVITSLFDYNTGVNTPVGAAERVNVEGNGEDAGAAWDALYGDASPEVTAAPGAGVGGGGAARRAAAPPRPPRPPHAHRRPRALEDVVLFSVPPPAVPLRRDRARADVGAVFVVAVASTADGSAVVGALAGAPAGAVAAACAGANAALAAATGTPLSAYAPAALVPGSAAVVTLVRKRTRWERFLAYMSSLLSAGAVAGVAVGAVAGAALLGYGALLLRRRAAARARDKNAELLEAYLESHEASGEESGIAEPPPAAFSTATPSQAARVSRLRLGRILSMARKSTSVAPWGGGGEEEPRPSAPPSAPPSAAHTATADADDDGGAWSDGGGGEGGGDGGGADGVLFHPLHSARREAWGPQPPRGGRPLRAAAPASPPRSGGEDDVTVAVGEGMGEREGGGGDGEEEEGGAYDGGASPPAFLPPRAPLPRRPASRGAAATATLPPAAHLRPSPPTYRGPPLRTLARLAPLTATDRSTLGLRNSRVRGGLRSAGANALLPPQGSAGGAPSLPGGLPATGTPAHHAARGPATGAPTHAVRGGTAKVERAAAAAASLQKARDALRSREAIEDE
jgi:hypothetical protein